MALATGSFAQWSQAGYMISNGTDTIRDCHQFKGFGTNVYSPTDSGLFVSPDNGLSWTNITDGKPAVNLQKMYSVHVSASGDLYAGSTRRLFKSTDNGGSWTWLNALPDSSQINDIAESGPNILVSFIKSGVNGVYYSSNGGASWTLATGISTPVRFFLTEGATVFLGGGATGVYKSTDNGQTWAVLGTGFPATAGIWSVKHNGSAYFANSISGVGLFASYDNGATWNNADASVFTGFCQVFSIAESNNMIVATMDGACNGGTPVKVSTDEGVTWNSFMAGLPGGYYPVLGRNADGSYFFIKSGTGQVFRYGVTTGIAENSAATAVNLYPNPNDGDFTVSLQVPGTFTFSVYDVLGTLVYSATVSGSNTMIHAKEWNAGIYLYRLSNKEKVLRSGKLVIQ